MKNVFIYMVFLLIGYSSSAQGVDVIFLIDNSLRIGGYPVNTVPPNTEYSALYGSVQRLMAHVLECNPANRVTVVQHTDGKNYGNLVYIESDFKNTAFSFVRRYNVADDLLNRTVDFVSDRLFGIPHTPPLGSGISLNRTPGNALVLYIFNGYGRTGLVDGSAGPGSTSFTQFDNFKNLHNATIMVTHTNSDLGAKATAAAISSLGGSYIGAVENYSADPYGPGATPRYYRNTDDYDLSTAEIEIMAGEICALAPVCPNDLVLTSPGYNVTSGQDNRQAKYTITASNAISNAAVGVYHAGEVVVLKSGFHSANGSRFRGYIQECPSGFIGRAALSDEKAEKEKMQEPFVLFPNPATDIVVISSDKIMTQLEIKSLTGTVFFSKAIKDKSYELNISNYPKGFYLVTATTETGEIGVKKLIKN